MEGIKNILNDLKKSLPKDYLFWIERNIRKNKTGFEFGGYMRKQDEDYINRRLSLIQSKIKEYNDAVINRTVADIDTAIKQYSDTYDEVLKYLKEIHTKTSEIKSATSSSSQNDEDDRGYDEDLNASVISGDLLQIINLLTKNKKKAVEQEKKHLTPIVNATSALKRIKDEKKRQEISNLIVKEMREQQYYDIQKRKRQIKAGAFITTALVIAAIFNKIRKTK